MSTQNVKIYCGQVEVESVHHDTRQVPVTYSGRLDAQDIIHLYKGLRPINLDNCRQKTKGNSGNILMGGIGISSDETNVTPIDEKMPAVRRLFASSCSLSPLKKDDGPDINGSEICGLNFIEKIRNKNGAIRIPRPVVIKGVKRELATSISLEGDDPSCSKSSPPTRRSPRKKTCVSPQKDEEGEEEDDEEDDEYDPETYFIAQTTSVKTSSNTLASLNLDSLSNTEMSKGVEESMLVMAKEREKLIASYTRRFRKWMLYFSQGWNILLCGFGSKRSLVQQFSKDVLSNTSYSYISVDGFNPRANISGIVLTVCEILNIPPLHVGRAVLDVQEHIETYTKKMNPPHLFLLINNIESEQLRSEKSQNILSHLASIKFIHILATVDHVNSALLWTQSHLSRFSWFYENVTTYIPYLHETKWEERACSRLEREEKLVLSSVRHVYRSLPGNTRSIFILLIDIHLERQADKDYSGVPINDLYRKCRELFLVSSQTNLHAHFTEFIDHKVIRISKRPDSSEVIQILVNDTTLKEFKVGAHEEDRR